MKQRCSRPARQVMAVAAAGILMGALIVALCVSTQSTHCCGTSPYATIFQQEKPLSRLDTMLAKGDGQAFAAIAEDPLLRRPQVLANAEVFAYREQRPLWGYLAWAASTGQAERVGLALALLTILSCGGACAVASLFLLERDVSPWWSLLVPLVGFETLGELTPELLAFCLLGLGILLWQRQHPVSAALAFSGAALTRETMLIGVGALAAWHLIHHRHELSAGVRRVASLSIPFCAYAVWILFVHMRVGAWPSQASQGRFALPAAGVAHAVLDQAAGPSVLPWLLVGLVFAAGAAMLATQDVLTFVTLAYLCLASFLGTDVWALKLGFVRTLVPMFVFGGIAFAGGVRATIARRADDAEFETVGA